MRLENGQKRSVLLLIRTGKYRTKNYRTEKD